MSPQASSSTLQIDVTSATRPGMRSRAGSMMAVASTPTELRDHSVDSSAWVVPDHIVVNDFMFCAEHGDEYCHACCCDHRLTNNIRIEDELEGVEKFDFELDWEDRQSINVYALGAVADITTEDSFQCEKHETVDCKECFNWVEVVKKHAEAVEEFGRWNLGSAHKEGSVLQEAMERLAVEKKRGE
ncbi:hypothetical protein CC1G_01531 [Coprinopsis cinerea okayama7|uniref:Uncharacterized protein n=1 Tax=Coprinopsis cinerea (strain Okayama-7 / 130 / ATCC MYA-4618 / FGSC 9003) TaxID=240176 RepID=A8NHX9_COPC7|nr:hypothetical protein CC1G_01531 [Coprinopsis cinerea okayama7\|eukprot:XP_001833854.2 hypothetical protein CC1G_01531 [Coprinopsis cinerea okayama7\